MLTSGWLWPAFADQPKVAIFDFELVDTSLEGEKGPRTDEQARLAAAAEQIRKGLAESGRFVVLDIAAVRTQAAKANLQACGGCDVDLAKSLGADFAITGVVQKVSNLILGMHVFVHDVRTGQLTAAMNADTDESWSRTVSYLLRNRLLAQNYGAPH